MELSIFFPAYNDAGTIASMVVSAIAVARSLARDFEVLVVDDGSYDRTPQILEELKKYHPELRVITHPQNRGYGGALRSGFANCRGRFIFYTDGDAQYDVWELKDLYPYRLDFDFINGYKLKRHDPLHRIIIGRLYHHFVSLIFGLHLKDVDCDFRLINRRVFDKVQLFFDSGVICVELMKKVQDAGFVIKEVSVSHHFRVYGKSQFFNLPRLLRACKDLFRLWWDIVFCKDFLDKISRQIHLWHILRRIVENDFKGQIQVINEEFNLREQDDILDIGCGTGMFSQLFKCDTYVGVDICLPYIEYARKKYKKDFRVMDATHLEFGDASFNNIFIFGIFHHLTDEDTKKVLSEARRVLRARGKMLVIEDVSIVSSLNVLGKMMHYFDRGASIRSFERYQDLFAEYFHIEKSFSLHSGICYYGVFVLRKEKQG